MQGITLTIGFLLLAVGVQSRALRTEQSVAVPLKESPRFASMELGASRCQGKKLCDECSSVKTRKCLESSRPGGMRCATPEKYENKYDLETCKKKGDDEDLGDEDDEVKVFTFSGGKYDQGKDFPGDSETHTCAKTRSRRTAISYSDEQTKAIATMIDVVAFEDSFKQEKTKWQKFKGFFQKRDKVFTIDFANNGAGLGVDAAKAVVDLAGTGVDIAGAGLPGLGLIIAGGSAAQAAHLQKGLDEKIKALQCNKKNPSKDSAAIKEACKALVCELGQSKRDKWVNVAVVMAAGFVTVTGTAAAVGTEIITMGAATPFVIGGSVAGVGIINKILNMKGKDKCAEFKKAAGKDLQKYIDALDGLNGEN